MKSWSESQMSPADCRLFKKFVQQGRSERRPEAYHPAYVEDLNDARTLLANFFSILLRVVRLTCR